MGGDCNVSFEVEIKIYILLKFLMLKRHKRKAYRKKTPTSRENRQPTKKILPSIGIKISVEMSKKYE